LKKEMTNYIHTLRKIFEHKTAESTKIKLLFILGAVGILFVVLPTFWDNTNSDLQSEEVIQNPQPNDYALYLSNQLENILGEIEGVGKICVMVTLEKEEECIYATDLSQDIQTPEQQQKDQKHVVIEKNGQEEALVTTRITPKIQGVIIVCEGGNNPVVVKKLTDAVTASLNIGPSRVSVSNSKYAE